MGYLGTKFGGLDGRLGYGGKNDRNGVGRRKIRNNWFRF